MNLINLNAGKFNKNWNYLTNCSEIELFIQTDCYYETIRMISYYQQMQILYQKQGDEKTANYFKEKLDDLLQCKNIKTVKDFDEYKNILEFCILCLTRFGIKTVWNKDGHIILTEEFKKWHHKWHTYIDTMDDDTLAIYRRCRYEGKGLEQFKLDQEIIPEKIEETLNSQKIKKYSHITKNQNIRQKLA